MAEPANLRPKNDVDRELLEDYTSALKTIRSVRSIFFGLLVLSLLVVTVVVTLLGAPGTEASQASIASLAPALSWLLGFAFYQFRCAIQRKRVNAPNRLFGDFVRHNLTGASVQ